MPATLNKKILPLLILAVLSSGCSKIVGYYVNLADLETGVFDLAAALGLLMIVLQGAKWLISTQPEEREECKKTIMYVLITLMVATFARPLVDALYCSNCGGCCT